MAKGISMEVFFDIADALDIDPVDLLNAANFPDHIIRKEAVRCRGYVCLNNPHPIKNTPNRVIILPG